MNHSAKSVLIVSGAGSFRWHLLHAFACSGIAAPQNGHGGNLLERNQPITNPSNAPTESINTSKPPIVITEPFLVMEKLVEQIEDDHHNDKLADLAKHIFAVVVALRLRRFFVAIVELYTGAELWHRRPFLPSAICGGELLNFTRRREWLTT